MTIREPLRSNKDTRRWHAAPAAGSLKGMVKIPIAALVTLLAAVLTLPLLAAGGGALGPIGTHGCGPYATILATIRAIESGGDYQAESRTSTASGAYQFIDSTWRHYARATGLDTTTYPRALDAPDHLQDAVATALVDALLETHNGDITMIPLGWYYPAAIRNPALMDTVPPGGNTLTPRQYQQRWLNELTRQTQLTETEPTCNPGAGGSAPTTPDGRWALPAPRHHIDERSLSAPHHTYPAWDLMLPEGTPIYAITAGTVVNIQHWPHNWWTAGCQRANPPAGCSTCGLGITIQTDDLRHTYCHNSANHVSLGQAVSTGQHIADSGNTGRSGAPHLHLELRIDNQRLCPQRLVAAIYHAWPVPEPPTIPRTGCWF